MCHCVPSLALLDQIEYAFKGQSGEEKNEWNKAMLNRPFSTVEGSDLQVVPEMTEGLCHLPI